MTMFADNASLGDDIVVKRVPKSSVLTETNLRRLDSYLDLDDAISLLYLMSDSNESSRHIYDAISRRPTKNLKRQVNFADLVESHLNNWRDKIVEALVEIECYEGLLKAFGVNKFDALFNVEASDRSLNVNRLRIFRICDRMDARTTRNFLTNFKQIFGDNSMPFIEGETHNLEEYFMFWQVLGVVDQNGKGFDRLAKCLRATDESLLDLIVPEGSAPSRLTVDDYNLSEYPIVDDNNVGLAVIVNQYIFDDPTNNRDSSRVDETVLTTVMESLKFTVVARRNLSSTEMCETIKRTINTCFIRSKHSIYFLVIMSHGQDGQVMGSDGLYVPIKSIATSVHESKWLNRIPKVMVVCACRGDDLFTNHRVGYVADGPVPESRTIRSDIMDLITVYSTIPGFISIRNVRQGSLFVQALCEVLERRPDLEICEIFTLVNHALMNPRYFRAYNPAKIAHPCEFNSRLLKKLYLKKTVDSQPRKQST